MSRTVLLIIETRIVRIVNLNSGPMLKNIETRIVLLMIETRIVKIVWEMGNLNSGPMMKKQDGYLVPSIIFRNPEGTKESKARG